MIQEDILTEPQTQALPDVPKWIGYSSFDDLPILIFIACLVKQEYDKLTISGEIDEDQLAELWLSHYSEYHKQSGNTAMDAILMQLWERDCLMAKVVSVKKLLAVLSEKPDENIAACIRLYGFSIPPFDGDLDAYTAHINRIIGQLKGLEHQSRQVQKILDTLKGNEITKDTFAKQLRMVSKHNGFMIKMADLTMDDYCGYIRDFREYCEQQKITEQNGG